MTFQDAVEYVRKATGFDEHILPQHIIEAQFEPYAYENGGIWGIHERSVHAVTGHIWRQIGKDYASTATDHSSVVIAGTITQAASHEANHYI